MKSISKFKRYTKVIQVLSRYGFAEVLDRILPSRERDNGAGAETDPQVPSGMYKRIRMAMEELGPAFIKLGQLLSIREDILPPELIAELRKLQDAVPPEPMDIKALLEEQFGIRTEEHFTVIEAQPFASASVSQVYAATLQDGSRVVLKVKRSDVEAVVNADVSIMKDLSLLLEKHYTSIRNMNLYRVISSFGLSVLKEMSFTAEAANIQNFRRNFKDDTRVYIPEVYEMYSNNEILCLEWVEGIKINDLEGIRDMQMDPRDIVTTGLDVYLRQILDFGLFHADPHPGNVFIDKKGRLIFLDFGSVGQLLPGDARILENMMINFVFRNPKGLIRNLKNIALAYSITNEKEFERDVEDLFAYVKELDLQQLMVRDIFDKLNKMLQTNRIVLPDAIYLLLRGVALIEGISKQLNADLNIYQSISPYVNKIAVKRLSFDNLKAYGLQQARSVLAIADMLPEVLATWMQQVKDQEGKNNADVAVRERMTRTYAGAGNKIAVSILAAALALATASMIPAAGPWPVQVWVSGGLTALLVLVLLVMILRERR